MSRQTAYPPTASPQADRTPLPLRALLALTTAAFVTVLTEALPAGVLPAMSSDLGVGESAMGQSVTIYAIGSAASAIPLAALTATWRRRRLLTTAIAGFAVANTVTAVSGSYPVTMAARFVAGVAAGLVWALLAGYARRLVPQHLQGRAVAVAMAGTPIALSLGVPVGTLLGNASGWRVTFWLMTALALALIGWIALAVPEHPGDAPGRRIAVRRVLTIPGVAQVLAVTLLFVLAHNVLYTYIAPLLAGLGMAGDVDRTLFVFGAASAVSLWFVGAHIDRHLRRLTIASVALFAVAATLLAVTTNLSGAVHTAAVLWGLGFGGTATLLQTALATAAGPAADTAQAALVTLWNSGIAAGAVAGGTLLDHLGSTWLPRSALVLLAPALLVTIATRAFGSPAGRQPRAHLQGEGGNQR